jgi:quinol monooxygenase YgiN
LLNKISEINCFDGKLDVINRLSLNLPAEASMLRLIARPTLQPERRAEINIVMRDLGIKTLKEADCIRYQRHQDNEYPKRFTFVESWENRELWRKHMEGPAISEFNKKISGGILDCELQEITKIA